MHAVVFRRSRTKSSEGSSNHDDSEGRVTSESSMELTLSLEKVEVCQEASNCPTIKFTKASLDEDEEAGESGEDGLASGAGDADDGGVGGEAGDDGGVGGEAGDGGGVGDSHDGSGDAGDGTPNSNVEAGETTPLNTSEEGEASIATLHGDTPTSDPPQSNEGNSLHISEGVEQCQSDPTASCESCEHLRSNEPVFLHIHVRPKPGTTYTYVPVNSSVGIDIPKSDKAVRANSPAVHQVKTCFCFAFAEKR